MKTTGESLGSLAQKIQMAARDRGMKAAVSLCWLSWGDVTISHDPAKSAAEAHAAARTLPHFDLVQTFRDGWGNLVSAGRVSA